MISALSAVKNLFSFSFEFTTTADMRRFYVPKSNFSERRVTFGEEESHHIARVLRMEPGETIEVFDGFGQEYVCRISVVEPQVEAEVIEKINTLVESPIGISLAQALIKFDKFDFVVQKATELGVVAIYPIASERTEIKLAPQKASDRVERWRKIAQEAAKQSRRSVIPLIHPIERIEPFLAKDQMRPKKLKAMPTEHRGIGFKDLLKQRRFTDVSLLVGPEGGWSEKDLQAASAAGYLFVSLGKRILRTETAGLVAITIVQYELGDLGRSEN